MPIIECTDEKMASRKSGETEGFSQPRFSEREKSNNNIV
jgi:hypothetical protein